MGNYKILKEGIASIYPITHPDAVRDENGQSVTNKLSLKQDKLTPGGGIRIDANNVISVTSGYGDVYTKEETNSLLFDKADKTTTYTKTEVNSAISSHHDSTKVDKETGKGLSDNNYTVEDKNKVAESIQTIKIGGVEQTKSSGTVNLPAYPTVTNTYDPVDTQAVSGQAVASAVSTKADSTNVYTKTEVDTNLATKQDILSGGTDISIVENTVSYTGEKFFLKGSGLQSIVRKDLSAVASGTASIALNNKSKATGAYAYSESNNNSFIYHVGEEDERTISIPTEKIGDASGESSHVEGVATVASGPYSHAEGGPSVDKTTGELTQTRATNRGAHAEGTGTLSSAPASHSEGYESQATGYAGHAEGNRTIASGKFSHTEGSETQATNQTSHAEGDNTISSGYSAHAEGTNCVASGQYSHSEGHNSEASGESSHAEGFYTKASYAYSHAEGYNTIASDFASHAENSGNTASGSCSHAEGGGTTASGEGSHTEGTDTTASGYSSHAEGESTVASGEASHAEGLGTTASGEVSHAEGTNTTASGSGSHAEGGSTVASGNYTHSEGYYTEAANDCEHAEGQLNKSNKKTDGTDEENKAGSTIHSIGIGTIDDRKNAFEVMQNGDIYVYGLGSYNGSNVSAASDLVTVFATKGDKSTVEALSTSIGNLSELQTTCKSSLVGAINELNSALSDIDTALSQIIGE